MKCQIVRDDMEISGSPPAFHENQWEERSIKRNRKMVALRFWKNGAIIEHKDAFRLVEMGVAIPADQECQDACGMTPEMIREAMRAQEKVVKGIHPEDYDAFDRGEMAGYNPNGSKIPGPNYKPPAPDMPLAEHDEDDEH